MRVITLVHGTWGRGIFWLSKDAPWVTDTSALCQSLSGHLGPDVIFRRFPWSGSNRHTARVKAAEGLRNYLKDGFNKWPEDSHTHFVIAHSHGGNVALSAIAASDVQQKIAGIACLATPFITARERDIGPKPQNVLSTALLALALFLIWKSGLLNGDLWTGIGLSVLGGCLLMSATYFLLTTAREQARKLLVELTSALPNKDQFLIIRSPADEASGALAVFQFLSQVSMRTFLFAWSWYTRLEGLLLRWMNHRRKLLTVGIIGFVVSIGLLFIYGTLSKYGGSSVFSTAALIAWGGSLLISASAFYLFLPFIGAKGVALPLRLVVSALLWPIIAALSVLMVLPYGWQAAVANLFLDVTAETSPEGTWEVHSLSPPTSEELGVPVPPLMHMVYENPNVLTKLGEWIKKRG